MLTVYDYPSANLAEKGGVDVILVGDSLGMVVLGYDSTVPVTLQDMIHHIKAVKRGAKDTFIITDMPFLTYHLSIRETLINAGIL
jgi:3-methyl-2-oxobutanoate hydroxymethyltransferase